MATVVSPVPVVDAPSMLIQEHFGRVASQHSGLSACVCTVRANALRDPLRAACLTCSEKRTDGYVDG